MTDSQFENLVLETVRPTQKLLSVKEVIIYRNEHTGKLEDVTKFGALYDVVNILAEHVFISDGYDKYGDEIEAPLDVTQDYILERLYTYTRRQVLEEAANYEGWPIDFGYAEFIDEE